MRGLRHAGIDTRGDAAIARDRWPADAEHITKAAQGALTSESTAGSQAFFGLVAEASLLGKIPLRRWPFGVETTASGGIAGGEVAEGAATPIRVPSLSSFRLAPRKFQGATIVTRAAMERGGEAVEVGLQTDLIAAAAKAIDGAFLASLTAAAGSFSGNRMHAIYLLNPVDAAARADLRLDASGGIFDGYPAITSNAVPAGSAIFLDSSLIAADWTDGEVDVSAEATVQMDGAPTGSSTTPTAAQMVSMFQTNSVAIRATAVADWHIGGVPQVIALGS